MTSRPSTEQLLVQVLLRSTQEVLRVLAEHSPQAPQHAQATRELELAFAPIWNRLPYLTLDILPSGIFWREQAVLETEEDSAELASTLTHSGIHAVTFVPGAEQEEVRRFLEVVDEKKKLDADDDQDLVTMLFREDLQYVRYTVGAAPQGEAQVLERVAEPALEDAAVMPGELADAPLVTEGLTLRPIRGGAGEVESETLETSALDEGSKAPAAPTEIRDAVREDAHTPEARGIVQLEKFDSTLYFLDQREIEYLKGAIDRQYAQDEVSSVLGMLLDILQLQSDPLVRNEVIGILETLMPYLLGTGRFDAVSYLAEQVRGLIRTVEFEPDQKASLLGLRVGVSETKVLAQLFHALEGGEVAPSAQNLNLLLRELSPEAIQHVLVWVGQLRRPEAKAALVEAIEGFFTEWPNALPRMLGAKDRTVVHRALRIAGRLKHPEFVEFIGAMLDTEDVKARKLAAVALAQIGNAPALRVLTNLVADADAGVRKVVLKAFANRPYRGAEKPLHRAMTSKGLEERDTAERRALFTAYGAIAGAGGVSALEPILLGRGGLARRPSSETRACAAVALGVIGTPAARFALEKASQDKDPLVRNAASSALRGEEYR